MRVIVLGRACLGRDALVELLRDDGHETTAAEEVAASWIDLLPAPGCVLLLDPSPSSPLDDWRRALAARGRPPRWIVLTTDAAPRLHPVDCTLVKPVRVEDLRSAVAGGDARS
jgi:hypothetical protein